MTAQRAEAAFTLNAQRSTLNIWNLVTLRLHRHPHLIIKNPPLL
jgi:hypothetical protein